MLLCSQMISRESYSQVEISGPLDVDVTFCPDLITGHLPTCQGKSDSPLPQQMTYKIMQSRRVWVRPLSHRKRMKLD